MNYAEKIQKVAGVDRSTALRLADAAQCGGTMQFLKILADAGYDVHEKIETICSLDGGEIGEYIILREGNELGRVPFSCCGIEIPREEDSK